MGRFGSAFFAALLVLWVCSAFNQTARMVEPIEDREPKDREPISEGRPVERIEFVAFKDLAQLTTALNYTAATWKAGQTDVPRLVLLQVPERFAEVTFKEVTVEQKKQIFFRMILPLILMANEEVTSDREALMHLKSRLETTRVPYEGDLDELRSLANKYRLSEDSDVISVTKLLKTLTRRIDIVPPSLALAQAATESAWGTSRFAVEGNALFGQWTFGGKGMVPEEQRAEKGDHKVASFRSPLHSVRSYLRNLNTNRAYREFREDRAAARAEGKPFSGEALASALSRYSERGQDYIKEIRQIIVGNDLSALDRSKLVEGPVYELMPVWRAGS
ncbi:MULTISPECIES: glucosaminidase domain-containing protein [Alphaproteobacteria]|uniref:glucosaminidase domain-containing protein n=1 Tax=Alphaproteobacteria TaxID=28211 RepID=UPI0032639AD0